MTDCSKTCVSEGNYWTAAIKTFPAFTVAFSKVGADGFVALHHAVQSDDKLANTFFLILLLCYLTFLAFLRNGSFLFFLVWGFFMLRICSSYYSICSFKECFFTRDL